MSGTQKIAI